MTAKEFADKVIASVSPIVRDDINKNARSAIYSLAYRAIIDGGDLDNYIGTASSLIMCGASAGLAHAQKIGGAA